MRETRNTLSMVAVAPPSTISHAGSGHGCCPIHDRLFQRKRR